MRDIIIEEITIVKYKTSNGKLFDTPEEASLEQEQINFEEWYDGRELIYDDGEYNHAIPITDLLDWIRKHRDALKETFGI